MATIKFKSPAETNPELNKKVVESINDVFNNKPDARFSILQFVKSLPKWYSKKTWSIILSLSAFLIGAIIFAFVKFGTIPGIITLVVAWGISTFFWNRWWKKNAAEFTLNISNIVERCIVDKDGNPVYVD